MAGDDAGTVDSIRLYFPLNAHYNCAADCRLRPVPDSATRHSPDQAVRYMGVRCPRDVRPPQRWIRLQIRHGELRGYPVCGPMRVPPIRPRWQPTSARGACVRRLHCAPALSVLLLLSGLVLLPSAPQPPPPPPLHALTRDYGVLPLYLPRVQLLRGPFVNADCRSRSGHGLPSSTSTSLSGTLYRTVPRICCESSSLRTQRCVDWPIGLCCGLSTYS